jgi:hypothetical protein
VKAIVDVERLTRLEAKSDEVRIEGLGFALQMSVQWPTRSGVYSPVTKTTAAL